MVGQGRQLVEAAQPEPLQEVRGGAVERRLARRLVPGLLDQARGSSSVRIDAVDVDPAHGATRARLTGWR